jgi:hypothetical protein
MMMPLPEAIATDLNAKVMRINVLQKLLLQERLNLKAKELGKTDLAKATIEAINEEVRDHLLGLLGNELGGATDVADPFEAVGVEMTPEKADALNAILTRVTGGSRSTEENPAVAAEPQVSSPAPRPPSVAPRTILDHLRASVGGDDAWLQLSPEDRAAKVKELEQQSKITYQTT